MRRISRTRQQRGAELVEFAITLPFIALLLLVVGQVAAAVSTQQILSNAAREGARLSVVPGAYGQTAAVQDRVVAYAAANGITLAASAVSVNQNELVPQPDGISMKASRVSVAYDYPLALLLGSSMRLGAAVEMRNFY